MIKRKKKYETSQFIFWLTEYTNDSHYKYDMIFSSKNVAPSASEKELKEFANFISKFIDNPSE